ncbi:MAG: alpha/beta hydrolase [Eubacteriales bacterium]|nr:alpha/beta hydrolase [Eubacteriales bacterium]
MDKKRRHIIESNEISEIRTYNLGGYLQRVLIDGKKKTNPMVIFLHGGPASPIPFCVGCRGMFPEITDNITMVYWDQLGCGINNHLIDDTLSISSFVDMTIDLIKCIKNDFPESLLWLYAMSWGSVLAARASVSVPELINGSVIVERSHNL